MARRPSSPPTRTSRNSTSASRKGAARASATASTTGGASAGWRDRLMADHYDFLETRDPAQRERDEAARLPEIIAHAMAAPGWAKQLAGADPRSVTSRAALAKLPV